MLAMLALAAGRAAAAPTPSGEFAVSDTPGMLTAGPDGNIWVALPTKIARVAPSGAVTEYSPAAVTAPVGITAGMDGNLWVTQQNQVVRIPPSNPGAAVAFNVNDIGDPREIVMGPDANLWTASADKVIKIPPANPAGFQSFAIAGLGARGIGRGNDGRLWVADFGGARILRVTTAGAATSVAVGGGPQDVVAGTGNQVAYTNPGAMPQHIGRIVPGGGPQTTSVPMTDPFGVALGPDGAYWVALFNTNPGALGRLTPGGAFSTLSGFSSGPRQVTAGPGDTLWASLEGAKKVARITGVTAPGADRTAPRVTRLRVKPRRFRVGRRRTARVAARRRARRRIPVGTKFGFTVSEPARVSLRIERVGPGRQLRRGCVRPRRRFRRRRRCRRYRHIFTLKRTVRQGRTRMRFTGRVGRRALRPGLYRVTVRARNASGKLSGRKRAGFRVVRPPRRRRGGR